METEFIYWRHKTPPGIKVEEISGGEDKSGRVWTLLAHQVFNENGRDDYRTIEHTPSGAPLLYGDDVRISVSHANHLMVVASLPRTPEADLEKFSLRTALGVDTEDSRRSQVLKVRERYLSEPELALIAADDLQANVTAWTVKEAVYKAALCEGLDFRSQIRIIRLPDAHTGVEGLATLTFPDGTEVDFNLYSYMSADNIVTLAYTARTATFKKERTV